MSKLLECGIDYKYITKKVFLERTMKEAKALSKMLSEINYDVFHYIIINKNGIGTKNELKKRCINHS